jgi:large subunit ribosomal protein L15
MKLHDLKPAPGSRRPKKRIGRGTGSGHGVTATKGTKGQKARTGAHMIPGFEGGQIRMIKRLPHKRGFNNPWRVEYEVYNVGELAKRFPGGGAIDLAALETAKIRSTSLPIKILGDGEIAVALTVTAHKISKGAREKIEAAGGTVNELGVKEVHGDRRDIDADDVTITHGEAARTVDVRTKKREAKARRRYTPAASEGGEDDA